MDCFWFLGLTGLSAKAMVIDLFWQQENRTIRRSIFFSRLDCHKPELTFRSQALNVCICSEQWKKIRAYSYYPEFSILVATF